MGTLKTVKLAFLCGILCGACAQKTPNPTDSASESIDSISSQSTLDESAVPIIEPARSGWVERQALEQVLDEGIGRFLGTVEIEAVFVAERFAGWRVLRHENPWIDLQVGDVVTAVNGRPIRTPDDLATLWRSLRKVGAIEVELARDDERVELRFAIAGT